MVFSIYFHEYWFLKTLNMKLVNIKQLVMYLLSCYNTSKTMCQSISHNIIAEYYRINVPNLYNL
jgi:hypothetical protein